MVVDKFNYHLFRPPKQKSKSDMKRQLKLKVWSPSAGMAEPFELTYDFCGEGGCFPMDAIFLQWTGLLDKHGKEIYEGDVMRCHESQANNPLNYVVVFNENESGFKLRWTGRYSKKGLNDPDGFYGQKISVQNYKVFEIIGNIYSNPEL